MAEFGQYVVNIKFHNNTAYPLSLQSSDTVADIRHKVAEKSNTKEDEIEIIFSGKILDGNAQVKELCLGQNSVLHVFQGRRRPVVEVRNIAGESQPNTSSSQPVTYQYYVFCKSCGDLQPGKLRVQCGKCKDGGIILERDPCSWSDVLMPGRIQGQCYTDGCDGMQIARFYFKCAGHVSEAMETAVPLQHIRPNRQQIECITCGIVSCLILVFPCELRHVICLECFQTYCMVSLNNRMFIQDQEVGYSLPCPAGCENSLIRENHHFCLLGTEQYERYKQFGAEQCLLESGGILCPRPGCGEGLFPSNDLTLSQCTTCDYVFCRQCLMEYHTGDCQMREQSSPRGELSDLDEERVMRARWEEHSMTTIDKTTKPCPSCRTRTEKFGGCMHMTCTMCKLDWCWLCEKSWDRDCQGNHWFG